MGSLSFLEAHVAKETSGLESSESVPDFHCGLDLLVFPLILSGSVLTL